MSQIATPRIPSRNVPNSSGNAIRAFVQKTYNILNDTNNSDIIQWSESGDSFLILDQQRLAKEVLGQYFKHESFNSFVRQLNNYGFRKIPDLRQGALRNESDSEINRFTHINGHFRRGKPDLLYLVRPGPQITRARGRRLSYTRIKDDENDDAVMDLLEDDGLQTFSPPSGPSTELANGRGQDLDVHAIFQETTAIKRELARQAAEADRLRNANWQLSQESMDCRTALQEQRGALGRVLNFLARVFEASNRHATENEGNNGAFDSDAIILRGVINSTSQDARGSEDSGTAGNFEVVEVEADAAGPTNNNVSTYSIETPTEDAGSPITSIALSDDGHFGSMAPNSHNPRTPTGRRYSTYSNNIITPDSSAHHFTILPRSVNEYGCREKQTGMLAPVLGFPTSQAPSPQRGSQYNLMDTIEADTTGNPPLPIPFDIGSTLDPTPTPPVPVHHSLGLANSFAAPESTGHEVNVMGHQIQNLADLFSSYSPSENNEISSLNFPASPTLASSPATPQSDTTQYPSSTTPSPTSSNSSFTLINIGALTLDTQLLDIAASSPRQDFNPELFLEMISHHNGAGTSDHGGDSWMSESSVDTNTENNVDIGVRMGARAINYGTSIPGTPNPRRA